MTAKRSLNNAAAPKNPGLVAFARTGPCRTNEVLTMTDYDEVSLLVEYVYAAYHHQLCTERESQIEELFAASAKHEYAQASTYERFGIDPNDPIVQATLKEGHEVFRRRVAERILNEPPDQVFINRCPTCSKITRTPKAQQCLWCGHDWH